jgi:DNA repair exonuclease SbcCD ATPase subunit
VLEQAYHRAVGAAAAVRVFVSPVDFNDAVVLCDELIAKRSRMLDEAKARFEKGMRRVAEIKELSEAMQGEVRLLDAALEEKVRRGETLMASIHVEREVLNGEKKKLKWEEKRIEAVRGGGGCKFRCWQFHLLFYF